MVKNFSKCLHCFFKMYNWLHFVSFGVLRAFRSNISLQFCSLLDGSFKICRYLCDKRSICMMFNCGIQTPTKNEGTIKFWKPMKHSFFYLARSRYLIHILMACGTLFHSVSSEMVKNFKASSITQFCAKN